MNTIFTNPAPANLDFKKLESLLITLGAKVIEGNGPRVRFVLNNIVISFHRPHPHKEAKPYQVKDARNFLIQAGIKP